MKAFACKMRFSPVEIRIKIDRIMLDISVDEAETWRDELDRAIKRSSELDQWELDNPLDDNYNMEAPKNDVI